MNGKLDIHGYQNKINKIDKYLDSVSKTNKELILSFKNYLFTKNLSIPRILKYMNHLKVICDMVSECQLIKNKDLDKLTKQDIQHFVGIIQQKLESGLITILPVLRKVWIFSWLEKLKNKIIPRMTMGLFDVFKKKATRYAMVIALIGALTSACKKDLPNEEATHVSILAAQVEKSLREGNPDKQKIKEFARIIASVRGYYDIDVEIPKNLERGIRGLELYYDNIHRFSNDLQNFRGSGRTVGYTYHPQIHIVTIIIDAERDLGVRLEKEREDIKELFNELLQFIDNSIKRSGDDYYKKIFEKMKADIIKGLQKLEK